MSLKGWADNGWLRAHRTSRQEIADLMTIVERDLSDARAQNISADWRFGIAYNAALKLCTILVHSSSYRPERQLHHFRTLSALPLILGEDRKEDAIYLEACRVKRNTVEYCMAGAATDEDAAELLAFVQELRERVFRWLADTHPELL